MKVFRFVKSVVVSCVEYILLTAMTVVGVLAALVGLIGLYTAVFLYAVMSYINPEGVDKATEAIMKAFEKTSSSAQEKGKEEQ